jgi:hypothetical protein
MRLSFEREPDVEETRHESGNPMLGAYRVAPAQG